MFPDEGSLVCGLYFLQKLTDSNGNSKGIKPSWSKPTLEIVRLKNLFRTTRSGIASYDALSTGYRHILINVKLDGGLIAGKYALVPSSLASLVHSYY